MNKTAPTASKDSTVLFARIPKYHKALLESEAIKKGVHISEILPEIIESFANRNDNSFEILKNVELVLLQHSKHTLEDSNKIISILQIGIKPEQESRTIQAGVVLLPATKEDKNALFYCQSCKTQTKNKYKHTIQVMYEQLVVGDCCFINDRYKDLVRALL